ncbi:MAG: D-erythronate dehydrogenase [Pseudomonadota bacterium]
MQIVVTGGAGFIGKKLVAAIVEQGGLAVDGEQRSLERLRVIDIAPPEGLPDDPRVEIITSTLDEPGALERVIDDRTDMVFHLAAVVSAAAEADFDIGMRANLDGTRAVLEACRRLADPPRLVFASSVAVYGGPVIEDVITDTTHLTPQTSYGVQKAVGELLVMDYHRKGFIDGRSLRLPTIVVRPGKPNKAASTWASSIIREPLAGERAVCPVRRESEMYVLSPRRTVEALLHAVDMDGATIGKERAILLPGATVNVGEMLAVLEAVGGKAALDRVVFEPDPAIQAIVDGWPRHFAAERARRLGFRDDESFEAAVRAHVEDELGGVVAT